MYVVLSHKVVLRQLAGRVVIHSPSWGGIKLGFGDNEVLDYKCERSIFSNTGTIEFSKGDCFIGQGTRIFNTGYLKIGSSFTITGNTSIVCSKSINIGNDVLISWSCTIMDTDFHRIYNIHNPQIQINEDKTIIIGDHVWVCANTMILKGALIGDNTVVAAGSCENKHISTGNCIIKNGIILKKDISWSR